MSVRGGDGGSGNFGGFWDQPDERSLGPWIIGVVIAIGFAVMGSIMYLIFFTDTKAGSDSSAQAPPAGQPSAPAPPATSAHTLAVPTAFDGYKPATGTAAKHALSTLHTQLSGMSSKFSDAYAKARTGIYDKGAASTARVMFLAVSAADSPALATELSTTTATTEDGEILTAFKVTKSHAYPAGPLGGALRCGPGKLTSGTAVTVCGWTDKSTSAFVVEPSSITGTAAGKVALALRNAAEQ